ncbi:MAG: hypothetical protein FD121_902 [Gallionellaceae bacterium]|nr:MAG: hypothetical protein FD121_902 [Gallionellaceae bacterium]
MGVDSNTLQRFYPHPTPPPALQGGGDALINELANLFIRHASRQNG